MYHFVTYKKNTGEITGYFISSTNEFVPIPPSPDEENLEVTEVKQIKLLQSLNPRITQLHGVVDAGKIRTMKAEPIFRGRIELACDMPDRDGDGLPELPADGETAAHIKATLRGAEGTVLTKEAVTIQFQVNRGLLSHRLVKTEHGVAEVEFRSVPETVRIQVSATAEGYERAILTLETIPADEYRELAEARLPNNG